jgi:tryptophan synthase alpha chain
LKGRISRTFERLSLKKEKGLALFVTAGYPSRDSTPGIISALEEGGADFVEIGIPFSDPLADGPVIQESSARAIANGVTLKTIMEDIREIRRTSEIPIVLMGYLNPILRYGSENFFRDAAEAGADGMVFPELPLEEFAEWDPMLRKNDLAGILLVAPTSGTERIRAIDRASEGFLYCVSTTGVTGGSGLESAPYLPEIRKIATKNRLMVGFGISTPEDGMKMARHADGVIVGSALARFLSEERTSASVSDWVMDFRRILNSEF